MSQSSTCSWCCALSCPTAENQSDENTGCWRSRRFAASRCKKMWHDGRDIDDKTYDTLIKPASVGTELRCVSALMSLIAPPASTFKVKPLVNFSAISSVFGRSWSCARGESSCLHFPKTYCWTESLWLFISLIRVPGIKSLIWSDKYVRVHISCWKSCSLHIQNYDCPWESWVLWEPHVLYFKIIYLFISFCEPQ